VQQGQGAIWLVGMMGAGKSVLGRRLARRLDRVFIDTDREIERRQGRPVAEIFAHDGEAAFRRLEREAIDAAAERGAIVALGGGAIAQPGMAEHLARHGTVVYLRARPRTLLGRIGDGASRPLLAGLTRAQQLERLETLLAERAPAYETAALTLDVDGQDLGRKLDALVRGLGLTQTHGAAQEQA